MNGAQVARELERRGELWRAGPGLIGLRGDALRLLRRLDAQLASLAALEEGDEWRLPSAVSLETLERAGYFASFPQWLTLASHLGGDATALERVATSERPLEVLPSAVAPPQAALPPALCYHVYAALEGQALTGPVRVTAHGTCWRHEGERTADLERGWAFTMREVVCLAASDEVERFRQRGARRALSLAARLGLEAHLEEASDPFFAPTARGRALLQRVKGLKQELVLPLGGGRGVAAASFNHHESYFGERFAIRLSCGEPAASGCVAYGLERWLLAFLVAHGPTAAGWPSLDTHEEPHATHPGTAA